MLVKKQPNPEPVGCVFIELSNNVYAIVDPDDYERLSGYHWRLVQSQNCFYAMRRVIRNGKAYYIRLHREIMHTPPGYECHHKNHNPRDCRKTNLENLTPAEHRAAHGKT